MLLLLRKYLTLGANEASITGIRRALGYQQITAGTLAAATKLTMPTQTITNPTSGQTETRALNPGLAIIQNNGTGNLRWRDDGTAPTAAIGMVLVAGAELDYTGDIANIQFIISTAGGALDVSLYGGV